MREHKRFNELTELHMKPEGKSDTVRGELIRAVNRIGYRFSNDGDCIGVGYGNETCNAAGRYIAEHGNDEMVKALGTLWDGSIEGSGMEMPDYVYESRLEKLIEATAEYADSTDPKLDEEATDMWDLYKSEDAEYDDWDEEDEWGEEDYWEDEEYND